MYHPRPLESVRSDTCLSDADKDCHDVDMVAGKSTGFRSGILDTHDSTIHSGHFMVSHVHDFEDSSSDTDDAFPPLPSTVKSPEVASATKFGYDFVAAKQETSDTYNFHAASSEADLTKAPLAAQPLSEPFSFTGEFGGINRPREIVAIDASLSRLFECMTLAYSKLTSPRWKTFKGMKVNVKDKIRLNNIIWREWHMQYIKGNEPFICQFAAPLSDDVHSKPEAVVLEGKYWKRRLDSVTAEYQKWRAYYRSRLTKNRYSDETMDVDASHAALLDRLATQDTRRIPVQRSPTPALMDEDFLMDLAADNFFASLSSQSFMFPVAKDIGPLGNADFIQPGLFPLQPNFEDFMDTLDAEMLTGSLISAAFVKSEPNLAAATAFDSRMEITPSVEKRSDSTLAPSPLSTLDLSQLLTQPSIGSQSTDSGSKTVRTLQSVLPVKQALPPLVQPARLAYSQSARRPRHSAPKTTRARNLSGSSVSSSQSSGVGPRAPSSVAPQHVSQSMLLPHEPQPQSQPQQQQQQRAIRPLQAQLQLAQTLPAQSNNQVRTVQMSPIQTFTTVPRQPMQTFTQTLSNAGIQLGNNTFFASNSQPTMIVRGGQLASLLQQKPTVSLVTDIQSNSILNNSISGIKLESDVVITTDPILMTNQSRVVPNNQNYAIPVHESSNSRTNVSQALLTSHSNFAVPKTSKRGVKKTRTIAPAPVARTQTTSSPSSQSVYLTHLLQHGTVPGLATKQIMNQRNDAVISVSPASSVEVSEFQKSLVMAAANQATFGTSAYATDANLPSPLFSQPITTYSFDLSMTSPRFSESALGSIPRDPLSSEMMDSPVQSPASDASASNSDTNLFQSQSMFPRVEGEREKYKEHRRVCHISAEQKRRSSIKNGFDMLHILIPSIAKSQQAKISKAAMLQKTAEYLRQIKEERTHMQAEEDSLRKTIETLNADINACHAQLPATGAPVTRQREDQLRGAFDEYVRHRTMQNWKFWIFSTIFQDLFTSYNNMVSTASVDELCRTILAWLDQHCSLIALRPVASSSLCSLSKTTSILSDPSRVPQQAADAVRRRDSDPTSLKR